MMADPSGLGIPTPPWFNNPLSIDRQEIQMREAQRLGMPLEAYLANENPATWRPPFPPAAAPTPAGFAGHANIAPAIGGPLGGTNMLSGFEGRPGGTYMGAGEFPAQAQAQGQGPVPIPSAPSPDMGSWWSALPYLPGAVESLAGEALAGTLGFAGQAAADQLGVQRPVEAPVAPTVTAAAAGPGGVPAAPVPGLAKSHQEFQASMRPLPLPWETAGAGASAGPVDLNSLQVDPPPGLAGSTSSPMRAIRMPDGKLLFTNRPEYGGEEMSVGDAGRLVREADRQPAARGSINEVRPASPFAGKTYNWPSSTQSAMAGLVAASERATRGEQAPGQLTGRMVEGVKPNVSGGAASQLQGTPEQQMQIALEHAMGATSLAQLGQQEKAANLSPQAAAALGSPQAVAMMVGMQMIGPQVQQKQAEMQAKIMLMSKPGTASYIADEKQRADAIESIRQTTKQELDYMMALAGLRPPAY